MQLPPNVILVHSGQETSCKACEHLWIINPADISFCFVGLCARHSMTTIWDYSRHLFTLWVVWEVDNSKSMPGISRQAMGRVWHRNGIILLLSIKSARTESTCANFGKYPDWTVPRKCAMYRTVINHYTDKVTRHCK